MTLVRPIHASEIPSITYSVAISHQQVLFCASLHTSIVSPTKLLIPRLTVNPAWSVGLQDIRYSVVKVALC